MNVAEDLYDYLKNNNRAEVVGFGTFYIKTSVAKINDAMGTITPPKREVLFTKEENGDMSFVNFMAVHEFISSQTAYTWIKQYSDSLIEKINNGKIVNLGKLGTIEKGLLGEYKFTPSEDLNLLGNSFALGTLRNVQTFDNEPTDIKVAPMETNKTQLSKEDSFIQTQNKIEEQITNAQQLSEEQKIQETDTETQERIIQHSEAEIETTVAKPENITEEEFRSDIADESVEDKTEQTIERASEFKDNVVVEDIKRKEENTEGESVEQSSLSAKEDELIKQAKKIIDKHNVGDNEQDKHKPSNRRKRFWMTMFWVVIVLLLLCVAFVFAHWMGLLKDIKTLDPITNRLSYYIPIREPKVKQVAKPIVVTPTETIVETPTEEVIDVEQEIETTPQTIATNTTTQKTTNKKTTNKDNVKQTNTNQQNTQQTLTKSQDEEEVIDNTPVVTQNHSKLGFDVVSGVYSNQETAKKQAQKAKRLGYDGYVINKIRGGTPIFYVSYGSRRTQKEAADLCTLIKNRLGGDFYIISR